MTTENVSPALYRREAYRYRDQLGWSIIPVNEAEHKYPKRPAIEWKLYQRRHADDEHIMDWWSSTSQRRLAIVTGRVSGQKGGRGLAVLDIDSGELAKAVKRDRAWLEGKYVVETPSGGLHIYFYERDSSRNRQWSGVVDIRAEGGYVVAPPTPGYRVISDGKIPTIRKLEALVDKFLDRYDFGFAKKDEEDETVDFDDHFYEGGRNAGLFARASSLRGRGLTRDSILDVLRGLNARNCHPPLEDEELVQIVDSASKYAPNRERLGDKPSIPDVARELRALHSIALIGEHGAGQLAVYQDGVYQVGDGIIKSTMTELLEGHKWSPARVNGVIEWLMSSKDTPIIPETPPLDKINLLNGVLDVNTGRLREHDPEQLSVVQLPVNYDRKAKCPNIERFLNQVLEPDLIPLFYEVAGWLMVPDITRKTAVLFLGQGNTGKSTAVRVLQALLGRRNYSEVPLQDLGGRFSGAELVGKLANFFDDLANTTVRDTGLFKVLTSGGGMTVERKYGNPYKVVPFARMVFAANEPPRTWDTTSAYFNRWLVFDFQHEVKKMDPFLIQKLTTPEELSGLFNKALVGLRKGHFSVTRSAAAAKEQFENALDPIRLFLSERTKLDINGRVKRSTLHREYVRWASEYRKPMYSSREFSMRLQSLELFKKRAIWSVRINSEYYWRGIFAR